MQSPYFSTDINQGKYHYLTSFLGAISHLDYCKSLFVDLHIHWLFFFQSFMIADARFIHLTNHSVFRTQNIQFLIPTTSMTLPHTTSPCLKITLTVLFTHPKTSCSLVTFLKYSPPGILQSVFHPLKLWKKMC